MDVDSRTKGLVQTFATSTPNNLLHREINGFGIFAMQQSRCNPDLICNYVSTSLSTRIFTGGKDVYRLSRKNCVTRFISTLRAGGSVTPCPRPGNGITSTYFSCSINSLINVSVFAKCTLSSPVPCAMSSLPFNPAALSIGDDARYSFSFSGSSPRYRSV